MRLLGAITLIWLALAIGAHSAIAGIVYWTGDQNSGWATLTGGTNSNWSLSATSNAESGKIVQSGDDVHFYTTGAANLATTLGGNFSVKSLTMDASAASAVSVAQGTSGSLTIGAGGITLSNGAGSLTISAPIVLGASQTWTDNSATNKLVISGSVSRTAANYTVDFVGNKIVSTTFANDATGIIGGWATFAGSGWAAMSGTSVVGYGGYTPISSSAQKISDTSSTTLNYHVTNTSSSTVGLGSPGTTDINSLMVDSPAARTIDIPVSGYLRLGKVGGVLLAAGAGSLTIGIAGNTGGLQAGGTPNNSSGEAIFSNFSSNIILVNAMIVDHGNPLLGPLSLTKAGSGTLVLAGSNSYSGQTAIHAGTLQVGNGGATGTLGTGNTIDNALLTFKLSDTLVYNGNISGSGGLSVLSGTITLGGSNTYTGGTTVAQGLLKAGSAQTLPTGKNLLLNGSLDLNTYAQTLASLSGTGTVTNSGSAAATLTLGSSNATMTFGGLLQDGGSAIRLVKSGGGTLTLSHAAGNAYSGGTTISGLLVISNTANSALGSGDVVVQSGGTLAGAGAIQVGSGKTISVAASGALAPGTAKGNSTEVLTLNAPVTFADDAVLSIGVRRNSGSGPVLQAVYHDYLQTTSGDLHLGGSGDVGHGQPLLELALSGTHSAGEYIKIVDLVNPSSHLYGQFRNFGQNQSWYDPGTGFDWWLLYRVDYNPSTGALVNGNDVIITNVPEPSTVAMLLGGASVAWAAMAWRRRRANVARSARLIAKERHPCYAKSV